MQQSCNVGCLFFFVYSEYVSLVNPYEWFASSVMAFAALALNFVFGRTLAKNHSSNWND